MSDQDIPQAEITPPRSSRWLLAAQLIPSIVGVFIACLALYAALDEADAVRKQQQAAVWPYLEVRGLKSGRPEDYSFTIFIENKGIGPARLRYFDIQIDGESTGNMHELVSKAYGETNKNFYIDNSAATVFSPGEQVKALKVTNSLIPELAEANPDLDIEAEQAFYKELVDRFTDAFRSPRIDLTICYCSVFDECWQYIKSEMEHKSVDICPIPSSESE